MPIALSREDFAALAAKNPGLKPDALLKLASLHNDIRLGSLRDGVASVWDKANTPLDGNALTKAAQGVSPKLQADLNDSPTWAAIKGFGAGALEGAAGVADSFTSPMGLAGLLLGAGEGVAGAKGLAGLAKAAKAGNTALNVGNAAGAIAKASGPNAGMQDYLAAGLSALPALAGKGGAAAGKALGESPAVARFVADEEGALKLPRKVWFARESDAAPIDVQASPSRTTKLPHREVAPFEQLPDGNNLMSTQSPTAKGAPAALNGPRFVNMRNVEKDAPQMLEPYAKALRETNLVTERQARNYSDADIVRAAVDGANENLTLLHDEFPGVWREPSKHWYETAHEGTKAIAAEHKVAPGQASGVVAVLSPQKDWDQNRSLAERIVAHATAFDSENPQYTQDIHRAYRQQLKGAFEKKYPFKTPAAEQSAKRQLAWDLAQSKAAVGAKWSELTAAGKARMVRVWDELKHPQTYDVVSPDNTVRTKAMNLDGTEGRLGWQSYENIEKALKILRTTDPEELSQLLGNAHKVRSFHNDIVAPFRPESVTSDTHHVAASHMLPLVGDTPEVLQNFGSVPTNTVHGIYGTYPIYAQATIDAAQGRNIRPPQMQSVPWEAIRSLFPDTFKTEDNLKAVRAMWDPFRSGEASREQIFRRILAMRADQNGGNPFTPPTWAKR